jgi:hypothetical protein
MCRSQREKARWLRQKNWEFAVSLGCIVRPHVSKKERKKGGKGKRQKAKGTFTIDSCL